MTLDPAINLATEILDEGSDDAETMVITWLRPLLPDGSIANSRQIDDPVPFVWVSYINGTENDEQGIVDDVVSVHCLYPKGLGQSGRTAAKQFSSIVHRRMMLLARTLEPITIGGHGVSIDYVNVFSRMEWAAYVDEQILHRVGRYRIGSGYAKLS